MLVNSEMLQGWCGYEQRAAQIRWLTERRIPWTPGRDGRPCTTLDCINAAMMGRQEKKEAAF